MGRVKGAIVKARAIDPEELREILKPIYEKLKRAGVSDAAMPPTEALVAKLLGWIDNDQVATWVKEYAKVMKK